MTDDRQRGKSIALWMLTFGSFLVMLYPMYVIRPFRFQGPRELKAAMWLVPKQQVITGTLLLMALVLAGWVIAKANWKRRVAAVFALLLCTLMAAASRINVFEKMFNPIATADMIDAAHAPLAPTEMVMVVSAGGESRAYPIYIMGYHHILNDRLKGIPVAVTY